MHQQGRMLLASTGMVNTVYALGDSFVLRIPRTHPRYAIYLHKESVVVPAARAAGVRTPALVVFDGSLDLLPVPYAIYERVHAATLGMLHCEPHEAAAAWHELGRDLARLHVGVLPDGPVGQIEREQAGKDLRLLVEQRATEGWFTAIESRWFHAWLDRLAPLVGAAANGLPHRLLHADTQPTNVMVAAGSLAYRAVIDWGDARWGDVAGDFLGPPLRAVPYLLAGHRDLALLDADDTIEARILWGQLRFTLGVLPRGAAAGLSWGERPLTRLLEIVRFFGEAPSSRWAALRPPP